MQHYVTCCDVTPRPLTRILWFFAKGRRIIAVHGIRNKGHAVPERDLETAGERMGDGQERVKHGTSPSTLHPSGNRPGFRKKNSPCDFSDIPYTRSRTVYSVCRRWCDFLPSGSPRNSA